MRNSLVAALVACTDSSLQTGTRRFLRGLSFDELQFIAEYLGGCILESSQIPYRRGTRVTPEEQARQRRSEDRDLKMILLLQYLGYCRRPWPHGAQVFLK